MKMARIRGGRRKSAADQRKMHLPVVDVSGHFFFIKTKAHTKGTPVQI